MKKLISFVLIFLLVAIAAWVVFGTLILSAVSPETNTGADMVNAAIAQDVYGNIYLVRQKDGDYELIAMDTNGNLLMSQPLKLGENDYPYHVADLFVASNRTIYLMVYRSSDVQDGNLTALALHKLYENGSYAMPVLELGIDRPYYGEGTGPMLSRPTEDDTHIYFGVYQEERIKTYRIDKLDMEAEAELLRDVVASRAPAHMLTLPSQEILYSAADGMLFYFSSQSTAEKQVELPLEIVVGELWYGEQGKVLYRDLHTGGIKSYSAKENLHSSELSALMRLQEGSAAALVNAPLMHINQQGRLSGVAQVDAEQTIFTGTRQYINTFSIARTEAGDMLQFLLPAVIVGVILLSILLWDFYCRVLKMRLSIRLRQGLLILAVVVVLMYSLSTYIITPMLEEALSSQYEKRVETAVKALSGALESAEDKALEEALKRAGAEQDGYAPLHFDLFEERSGTMYLAASSDSYAAGTNIDLVPKRMALSAVSSSLSPGSGAYHMVNENVGLRGYYVYLSPSGRLLSASASMGMIEAEIASVNNTVDIFLLSMGGILVIALFLIESITARNIRKLKKGVDAVGAGNYDVSISIGSGDEVEDLANSFNSMTVLVRSNLEKMRADNSAYYRFVPESMVRLLRADSIGDLQRGSCVKERVTILMVRFTLLDGAEQFSTDELFLHINDAMQAFTSAVPENGGTVYDMSSEGFRAVFQGSSGDALRAALYIRNQALALNRRREENGQGWVDVRMVLSNGDVMLGLVGDEARLSPTAISDCIRDAERALALLNKSEVYICCTEEALHGIEGDYRRRFLGVIEAPSGKELRLYDFFDGDPFSLAKQKEMTKERFHDAVEAFYRAEYESAKTLFLDIVRLASGDAASVQYMYYADRYRLSPPTKPLYRVID
ncbi:HAMP domain-containing protein [Christensenellaceae bacterium OttesenSCG-928-M15]|nr:HAMP domain-containing protein [Christensenellaceae bacterium OttesenSCG-928-M15]